MKKIHKLFLIIAFCACAFAGTASAQDKLPADRFELRAKTFDLIGQNRYLDALPLLEKLAPQYLDDADVWAHYGIAILARSATLQSASERRTERIKGYNVLVKARELGTKNTMALSFLDQLTPDGADEDNMALNPEAEKFLREGEAFFGRGDYDNAYLAYEKAYKIVPKSYEAALFMGDSRYAAKRYQESMTWFAKAVEIDPNREMAYRFWGDALMSQKRVAEARDKFIDALIAEPNSRMTWDRLGKWVDETSTKVTSVEISPPGNDAAGAITVNENLLKADDGTIHWKLYNDVRRAQVVAKGGSERTLSDEAAAYRKVADAVRGDLKAGKIKYPDKGLTSLVKLDAAGLLEPYILLVRNDGNFADYYLPYKEKNQPKLRQFVIEFLLGLPN